MTRPPRGTSRVAAFSRHPLAVPVVLTLLGLAAVLPGCKGPEKAEEDTPAVEIAQPLPTYADLAAAERARTEGLGRLWARVAAQIRFPEEPGGPIREEQVEGHLQIEQPGKVAVSLGKLSEILIYLGSDGERSFLLDLLNKDDRVAVVYPAGELELGSADGVLAFDPADLPGLLALAPLPDRDDLEVRKGPDRRPNTVVVTIPDPRGDRRVYFDRDELRPVAVELDRGVTAEGQTGTVIAELSGYDSVSVRGQAELRPRAPMQITVKVPAARVELAFWLSDAQNRPIRAVAFDVDKLSEVYRVDRTLVPADPSSGPAVGSSSGPNAVVAP